MPSAALTSQFVRAANCPTGRTKADFFDTDQRGFLLEVRSSGRKTFYQRYVDAYGRQRQFKIGAANVLTVEQARRKGRSVMAEALLGADPQVRRKELRATPTLARLVSDRYLPHAMATKRSWHVDEIILRINILPALGHLTLDRISSERIAELIKDMRTNGTPPRPPIAYWWCFATSSISLANGKCRASTATQLPASAQLLRSICSAS